MSEYKPLTTALCLLILSLGARADTDAVRLSDPTQPPRLVVDAEPAPVAAGRAPSLRLQAVFTGPKGDAAMINGQLINRGERVAGAVLRQVRADGVLLERDGETWEMPIGVAAIKQPAGQNRRAMQ